MLKNVIFYWKKCKTRELSKARVTKFKMTMDLNEFICVEPLKVTVIKVKGHMGQGQSLHWSRSN